MGTLPIKSRIMAVAKTIREVDRLAGRIKTQIRIIGKIKGLNASLKLLIPDCLKESIRAKYIIRANFAKSEG